MRHQEKQHREDREQKEGCPIPGKVLSISCQLSKKLAVSDVHFIDQKAENNIITGVNDFYNKYGRRNLDQAYALEQQK